MQGADSRTERVVDLPPDECPDVARAAALLVRNWLNRGWSNPTLPPPAPPIRAPTPEPVLVAAPSNPPPPDPARLQLRAAAGAYGDRDGRSGLQLAAGAEWRASPSLVVGLAVARDAPAALPLNAFPISVELWRVALLGGWETPLAGAARLDLLGGPALCILIEDRIGSRSTDRKRLVDAAAVATARLSYRLFGPVAVFAGVEGSFRATRETLNIAGIPGAQPLSRARIAVGGGVAWEVL